MIHKIGYTTIYEDTFEKTCQDNRLREEHRKKTYKAVTKTKTFKPNPIKPKIFPLVLKTNKNTDKKFAHHTGQNEAKPIRPKKRKSRYKIVLLKLKPTSKQHFEMDV